MPKAVKRNYKIIWALVNCNSKEEALKIGNAILKKRLASCFDFFNRALARYFWPPKSNLIEESKGCLLCIETFEKLYNKVADEIERLHSDKEPFIGFIRIEGSRKSYFDWMKGEIK